MEAVGAGDMQAVMHDVERAYILTEKGDVLAPGKCVMRWGSTPEDENLYGRINAMPGMIGGEYNMAGIKWIGSGPMNYKKGLPRASVTIILNDPETKLPLCIADGTEVSAKRTGCIRRHRHEIAEPGKGKRYDHLRRRSTRQNANGSGPFGQAESAYGIYL